MIGPFAFEQTLVGSFRPPGDRAHEKPLTLHLRAARPRMLPMVSGSIDVVGEIDLPGIADRRPVRGTLGRTPSRIGTSDLALELEADDGRPLSLALRSELRLRQPLWSLSRLVGTLAEGEAVLGRIEVRVDYRAALGRLLKM